MKKTKTNTSILRYLWKLRYRFYSLLVSFLLIFTVYADKAGILLIVVNRSDFDILSENFLVYSVRAKSVSLEDENVPNPKFYLYKDNETIILDGYGNIIDRILPEPGFDLRSPSFDINDAAERKPSLSDIIPVPSNPELINKFFYPRFNINDVPIIYSTKEDLFQTLPDGSLAPRDLNDRFSSPIQIKLRDGIVHLYTTPLPGEIGNSYIVGHSSNYADIISPYNSVFKPLERRSSVGDEFIIYDMTGRKLTFRVFETKEIKADDSSEAYKSFGDRRVVTLQTSIVRSPTVIDRWLTRGELVPEKSN
jgi:hypothetical protein